MRRGVGVVFVAALAAALAHPVASAASLATPSYDFSSAVFMQVFGETNDRASESPLRSLALRVDVPAAKGERIETAAAGYLDLAESVRSRVLDSGVLFSAPAAPRTDRTFPIAAYQPVEPAADVALESGEVSFTPIAPPPAPAPAATAAVVPLRVGPVRFEGRVGGNSTQTPQLALHDTSYGAGADFALRAGARRVNVDVSSSYEQLTRNDAGFTPSAPAASLQLPGASTSLVIPNYGNLSRLTLGAGVAVPLINGLTLNLNYDTARLLGSYGLPGLTNLDAIDNAYGGGLTFALPHSSSTLSLSAYQFRYQDNILPANSVTQTRENLNFTVKF